MEGTSGVCACMRVCVHACVCVIPKTEKQTVPETQAHDGSSMSGLEDGEGMGELVLVRCVVGVLCVACQLKCVVGVLCVAVRSSRPSLRRRHTMKTSCSRRL